MLDVHIDAGVHMATKSGWAAFPHDAKGFAHAGDALKKAWPTLHAGDCDPFPVPTRAAALLKAAGKAAPKAKPAPAQYVFYVGTAGHNLKRNLGTMLSFGALAPAFAATAVTDAEAAVDRVQSQVAF
mgnify:CR=1 FL=1